MVALIFYLSAITMIVGAVGVITARNPVHSAMFLVLALMSIAVDYVLLGADLAAAVQVIVYASAVVILFLFVILLLGVDEQEADDPDNLKHQRITAVAVSVLTASVLILVGGTKWASAARGTAGSLHRKNMTNVEVIASNLFTNYAWVFEITAILLVAAVVGAVVLAKRATTQVGLLDSENPDEILDPEDSDQGVTQ